MTTPLESSSISKNVPITNVKNKKTGSLNWKKVAVISLAPISLFAFSFLSSFLFKTHEENQIDNNLNCTRISPISEDDLQTNQCNCPSSESISDSLFSNRFLKVLLLIAIVYHASKMIQVKIKDRRLAREEENLKKAFEDSKKVIEELKKKDIEQQKQSKLQENLFNQTLLGVAAKVSQTEEKLNVAEKELDESKIRKNLLQGFLEIQVEKNIELAESLKTLQAQDKKDIPELKTSEKENSQENIVLPSNSIVIKTHV